MFGKQCHVCARWPGEQTDFDLEHVQSGTLGQGLGGLSRRHVPAHSSRQSAGDGRPPPPPAAARPASFLPALGNQPGTSHPAPHTPGPLLLTEVLGVAPLGPHDVQPGSHLSGSARGQNE